jgi:hypothetical protein
MVPYNKSTLKNGRNTEPNMTIERIETETLAGLIAGLVKEGLTFKCFQTRDGRWTIELTGGF